MQNPTPPSTPVLYLDVVQGLSHHNLRTIPPCPSTKSIHLSSWGSESRRWPLTCWESWGWETAESWRTCKIISSRLTNPSNSSYLLYHQIHLEERLGSLLGMVVRPYRQQVPDHQLASIQVLDSSITHSQSNRHASSGRTRDSSSCCKSTWSTSRSACAQSC